MRSRYSSRSVPRCAAAGVVEHRERQPGLEHLVRDLDRIRWRLPRERPLLVGLERVRQRARRASCTTVCVASASALVISARSSSPAQHARPRSRSTSCWRRRAADARVVAVLRVGAEPVGEAGDGVVVLPGLAVHDLQCCRAVERSRRAGAASAAAARATCFPHVERLGRALGRRRRRDATCCAATPMMHGVRGSTSSPRLPHRRALLGERLRSFLRVLGLEDLLESFDSPSRTECAAPCRPFEDRDRRLGIGARRRPRSRSSRHRVAQLLRSRPRRSTGPAARSASSPAPRAARSR